jgi:hypothetical protein
VKFAQQVTGLPEAVTSAKETTYGEPRLFKVSQHLSTDKIAGPVEEIENR